MKQYDQWLYIKQECEDAINEQGVSSGVVLSNLGN